MYITGLPVDMEFKQKAKAIINESIRVKRELINTCLDDIIHCGAKLADTYKQGGKLMLCGNGGSAADAQHLAAELVIRFRSSVNRAALAAIALTVDPSMMTAGGNDIGFENVFARALDALGNQGDALIAISTSGNSENVYRACQKAKEKGITTIGLLGADGGKIIHLCDLYCLVPAKETARIQESHILIGHIWCEMIEEILFPELF